MARVARLSGLCAWSLVLAVALLVWWPVPANAYGATAGGISAHTCWYSSQAGFPSYGTSSSGSCAYKPVDIWKADWSYYLSKSTADDPNNAYSFRSDAGCTGTNANSCSMTYWRKSYTGQSTSGTFTIVYQQRQETSYHCGIDNTIATAQGCFCKPGYAPQGGQCVAHSCPKQGTKEPGTDDKTYSSTSGDSSYMGCLNGCLVSGAFGARSGGQSFVMGPLVHTGQMCNGNTEGGTYPPMDENSGGNPPQNSCPAPQCPGTVNGSQVCVPCDDTTTGHFDKPSDGSSGGKDTTTTCTGGVCTTTTKDVDGSGNAGSGGSWSTGTGGQNPNANGTGSGGDGNCTGSDCQDMPSFCEDNPESPICKESNWGGTCEAQFSCDGDEVQCAIAKEQHNRNCTMFVTETDLSRKGNESTQGGDRPADHPFATPNTTAIDFSSRIDTSNPLSGACPVGKAVTIVGVSVVMVSPELCSSLELAGTILVAIGALASMVIVFRG